MDVELKPAWTVRCPNKSCGLFRTVEAPSEEAARAALKALGWTNVCARCTDVRNLTIGQTGIVILFSVLLEWFFR
jgi:hypothetical protein